MSKRLVFFKLGGSLITVKDQPLTPRLEVLDRLAQEIAEALAQDPGLQVVLGHGSGSFGHTAADRYHTRQGVKTAEQWQGFGEVRRLAAELNQMVMAALAKAHLSALVFPPSSAVIALDGRVAIWEIDRLQSALYKGMLPVVYGDAVYDQVRGGTILSTEDLFTYLVRPLKPARLLYAGLVPGVWADYPANTHLLAEITPASYPQVLPGLKGSSATDVTGGMLAKVQHLVDLVQEFPEVEGMIFSGETPGNVRRALLGERLGTTIHASQAG